MSDKNGGPRLQGQEAEGPSVGVVWFIWEGTGRGPWEKNLLEC